MPVYVARYLAGQPTACQQVELYNFKYEAQTALVKDPVRTAQ